MAERKILNDTYKCDPMRATDAIELLGDLTRIASQGSGRLSAVLLGLEEQAAGDEAGGQLADLATFAAIGDILQANTLSDLRGVIERVVTAAQVRRPSGYDRVNLDDDFTANLGALLPVAKFVLEVNFRDFFGASGGGGALSKLRAAFRTGT